MNAIKNANLSLSGAAILTTYVTGAVLAASKAARILVVAKSVTLGTSNSTSAELKLQGSPDGLAGWVDLPLLDVLAAPAAALASSLTKATGSNATVGIAGEFASGYPFVRAAAKFTGGVGKVGETLSVDLYLS